MIPTLFYFAAQLFFIQMALSQSTNFNPSSSLPGPINTNQLASPVNANPISNPVGSNRKGSFAGSVVSTSQGLTNVPATGPVNPNLTSGPVNSNPVRSNNKRSVSGPVGSTISSFTNLPTTGPINSNQISGSGPVNSNSFLGQVGPINKYSGAFGSNLSPYFASPFGQSPQGTPAFGLGTNSFGLGQYSPYEPYGPSAPYTSTGTGNVAVNGELPVAGNTGVVGQVPVTGTVQFNGKVPASGAVTITGVCSCGTSGFYGF